LSDVPTRLPMSNLSKNAECILRILKTAESLTTTEILEAARAENFANLCADCAGGDTIAATANQLVERGLISRKFGKGGYRWQLVRQ